MQRSVFKLNCPFCDVSDSSLRVIQQSSWENVSKIVSCYFSNFTYDHFVKLCDSCLAYTEEFYRSRKLWLYNEAEIHKKRIMGQFKGLKDIVNLKKKSFLICRLCFGGSPSEEVIFIYHENKMYQPGYIQNMLDLHANNIDLSMTENPVICQRCWDGIQTFDALYQMCLQNQASKAEPDLKVKSSSDSQQNGSVQNETEKIVHVQLKKNSNNSLVLHPVTEAENAVSNLMRNKGTSGNPVILNGWTTKRVVDMVQNPKCSISNKTTKPNSYDVNEENNNFEKSQTIESVGPDSDNTVHNKTISNNGTIEYRESTSGVNLRQPMEKPENSELYIPSSKSVIIEIEDSDEEEEIVIPSILSISTVDEAEDAMDLHPQIDTVGTLLSNNDTECEVEPIFKEYSETETAIEGSEVTSVEDSSDSTFHILEENLSDFLQFKKESFISPNCLKRSVESVNNDATSKKARSESTSDKTDLKTYSSAYEEFLQKESDKHPMWKLLRGYLPNGSKYDEYCSWFPFYPKKYYRSNKRKCFMTALDNRLGSRIYRCNVCLHIMNEKASAISHECRTYPGRRRLICSILKCNFYTFNDLLFSQHKKAHTIASTEVMQKLKCTCCEFYSADKNCMKKHIKAVHSKGAVKITISKCNYCFFESPNPDILAHHISVRHSYKKKKISE